MKVRDIIWLLHPQFHTDVLICSQSSFKRHMHDTNKENIKDCRDYRYDSKTKIWYTSNMDDTDDMTLQDWIDFWELGLDFSVDGWSADWLLNLDIVYIHGGITDTREIRLIVKG